MPEPFSSAGKDYGRDSCLELIGQLHGSVRRPLLYLGLPSPWMGDVAAWRPYLGRILAVEIEKRVIPDLLDRAYTLGLLYKVCYFVGDIDQILQTGVDSYGRDLRNEFPVDLINLDYCSGLVYSGYERISAIQSVFDLQATALATATNLRFPYFLLFITHNAGRNVGNQTVSRDYISYLTRDAQYYDEGIRQGIEASVQWYRSDECPPEYRHKAFVLGKVLEFAQGAGFRVEPLTALAYVGDGGAHMMHYQFKIGRPTTPLDYPIPADSGLGVSEILNYPVLSPDGQDLVNNRPIVNVPRSANR